MTSDEERREVAEELRNYMRLHNSDTFEAFYTRLNGVLFGDDGFDRPDGDVFKRLADLIDCPTCEMEGHPGARHGVCTRCGAFVRRDAVTNCTSVIPVKYCPNCRAEVI